MEGQRGWFVVTTMHNGAWTVTYLYDDLTTTADARAKLEYPHWQTWVVILLLLAGVALACESIRLRREGRKP